MVSEFKETKKVYLKTGRRSSRKNFFSLAMEIAGAHTRNY
jgi:hypothetical protein